MNPILLIPARMASTRLPGKPLADIGGVPMIVRVWAQAMAAGLGMPTAASVADRHARELATAKAQGRVPGKIGEFAGNVVGTIPAALASKNPLVAGALSGAMLTDNRDLPGILADAGIGAVTGGIASGVLGAAGRALKGGDKAVRKLLDGGVDLTPGQVAGGIG